VTASHDKRDFFDGIVPQWILDTEERSARLAEIFIEYELPTSGPVLDIGSGVGILLPYLSDNGSTFVAEIEISMEMLRMARVQHRTLKDVCFMQSDAHNLPFASASFTTAHCFSVYPHFDAPELALREIRRCLRPGGILCILHLMGHEELNELHREAGRAVESDILPPVDDLARTIAQQGFAVTRSVERSDLYLLLATRM